MKGELYLVMDLCSLGSLLDHLRKFRHVFINEIVENGAELMKPVISGDGYLSPNHLTADTLSRTVYQVIDYHIQVFEMHRFLTGKTAFDYTALTSISLLCI